MAINSKDIETLWQRYSAEGVGKGISVAQYFESNGVPYHTFEKWYKKKYSQSGIVDCVVSSESDGSLQVSGRGELKDVSDPNALHEANLLMLDISKAKFKLGWEPRTNIELCCQLTADWYKRYQQEDVYHLCVEQITAFASK